MATVPFLTWRLTCLVALHTALKIGQACQMMLVCCLAHWTLVYTWRIKLVQWKDPREFLWANFSDNHFGLFIVCQTFGFKQCRIYEYKQVLVLQLTVRKSKLVSASVQFTVYSVHCTVYSVQSTVHSVQFTVYSVQCTVYRSVQQWTAVSRDLMVGEVQGCIVLPQQLEDCLGRQASRLF